MIKNNTYQYAQMKQFPKSAINGLTKKLSGFRFAKMPVGMDYQQSDLLRDRMKSEFMTSLSLINVDNIYESNANLYHFKIARKITKEQTQLGKAWLKNHFFKLDGSKRNGKNTKNVSDRVLAISKSASRFEFIGVIGCMNSFGDELQFLPVYRTYNTKGEYFDYAPIHWGQPIIMEGY